MKLSLKGARTWFVTISSSAFVAFIHARQFYGHQGNTRRESYNGPRLKYVVSCSVMFKVFSGTYLLFDIYLCLATIFEYLTCSCSVIYRFYGASKFFELPRRFRASFFHVPIKFCLAHIEPCFLRARLGDNVFLLSRISGPEEHSMNRYCMAKECNRVQVIDSLGAQLYPSVVESASCSLNELTSETQMSAGWRSQGQHVLFRNTSTVNKSGLVRVDSP